MPRSPSDPSPGQAAGAHQTPGTGCRGPSDPSPGRLADTLRWPHPVLVKLDPPSDLQSNVSSDSCVLTWGISPALEPLASLLSYELAFKRQEEAWEVTPGLASGGPVSPHSTQGEAGGGL